MENKFPRRRGFSYFLEPWLTIPVFKTVKKKKKEKVFFEVISLPPSYSLQLSMFRILTLWKRLDCDQRGLEPANQGVLHIYKVFGHRQYAPDIARPRVIRKWHLITKYSLKVCEKAVFVNILKFASFVHFVSRVSSSRRESKHAITITQNSAS